MQIKVDYRAVAPPEVVFAAMTDVEHWPRFIRGIEKIEMLTAGPTRAGARFRETRKMHGRIATEEMTVARFEPPHRFDLTAENHGARYHVTHEIFSDGAGSWLVVRFGAQPLSLAAHIFSVIGWLFVGAIRRQLQQDLADVKAEAERRAAR